jgi:hypothetical protein
MFRYLQRYIRGADLAICHVETPMTSRSPHGYPIFDTPPAAGLGTFPGTHCVDVSIGRASEHGTRHEGAL